MTYPTTEIRSLFLFFLFLFLLFILFLSPNSANFMLHIPFLTVLEFLSISSAFFWPLYGVRRPPVKDSPLIIITLQIHPINPQVPPLGEVVWSACRGGREEPLLWPYWSQWWDHLTPSQRLQGFEPSMIYFTLKIFFCITFPPNIWSYTLFKRTSMLMK